MNNNQPPESKGENKNSWSKPPVSLVPPKALLEVANIMGYGVGKYGGKVPFDCDPKVYLDAAMRHIVQQMTEDYHGNGELAMDEESGMPAVAHAAASLMIYLEIVGSGQKKTDYYEKVKNGFQVNNEK